MLSSFSKNTFQSFFFFNLDNDTYIDKLVKSDKNKLTWVKTTKDSFKSGNNYNYLYKPDNLLTTDSNLEYYFIRKSKSFNKGRYSRNRQVYRTGVYMCFYINVIALYLLWFYFYKFKFKFTYFWWLFILLPFSFINARALKYNLYFPKEFLLHFNNYINWFLYFFKKK